MVRHAIGPNLQTKNEYKKSTKKNEIINESNGPLSNIHMDKLG